MRYAVLCSGQGTQHADMLRWTRDRAAAAAVWDAAKEALGFDPRDGVGSDERYRNGVAQPLLCVHALATWRCLAPALPPPEAFAGYSVGELAAYGCAGALDERELARLARCRAERMDRAAKVDAGLLALRGGAPEIAELLARHPVHRAIEIDDGVEVVGGLVGDLDELARAAPARGVAATPLRVGVASHTPLLAQAAVEFRADLDASSLGRPAVPVVAGISAKLVRTRADAVDTLARQIAEPIRWGRCLDALFERGCRAFLELGPGNRLAKQALDRLAGIDARSVEDFASLDGAAAWLSDLSRR